MNYFDETIFLKRANELFGQSQQKEISAKTGLGQSTISNIKTYKPKNTSIDTVCAISRAYGVSVDWLVGMSPIREIEAVASERREICDILGLSDSAIMTIQSLRGTPTGKGLENLLMLQREGIDCGEVALLDYIADFLNSIYDHATGDIEFACDESGLLKVLQFEDDEINTAKVSVPPLFADMSFSMTEVKLEQLIYKIERDLRWRKDLCMKIKKYRKSTARKTSKKGEMKNGNNKKA